MSEPFIAEIRIFAGNFAPRGWAFCNGQLLPISQNTALFALIGTTYGGDGRTTTALPDLQGRAPMHPGRGPGLMPHWLGEKSGSESSMLSVSQLPSHSHRARANSSNADRLTPANNHWGTPEEHDVYRPASADATNMRHNALEPVGSGQLHNNMQPYLALNFIIALTGIFPSRS